MSLEAFQAANLQQQALVDELRRTMAAGAQARGQQAPAIAKQERINQLRQSNMAQIPGAPGYANVSIGGGLADMMRDVRADQMQGQLDPVLEQTAQAIAQAETAPQLFEAASMLPEANRAEALRMMQREETLTDAATGREHELDMQAARLTANAALQEDQQEFQTSEREAGQDYEKEILVDEQAFQTATEIATRSQQIMDEALKRQQELEDAKAKAKEVAGDVEIWGDEKTGELSYAVRTASGYRDADNMDQHFDFANKTRIPDNDTRAWNAATTQEERIAAGSGPPMTPVQIQSTLNNIRKPTQDLGALVQAANAIDAQLQKWAEEGRTDIPGVGLFTGGEGVFSALMRKGEDAIRGTEGANFAMLLQMFNNQKIRESAGLSQTISERMAALREMGAAPLSFEEQFALAWAQQTEELRRRVDTHRRTVLPPVQAAYSKDPQPKDPLNVFTTDYTPLDTSILDSLTSANITDAFTQYMEPGAPDPPAPAPTPASALPQSTGAAQQVDISTPHPNVPADRATVWDLLSDDLKQFLNRQAAGS